MDDDISISINALLAKRQISTESVRNREAAVADDIVTRLRSLSEEWWECCNNIHLPLIEAADEIEQLRGDLLMKNRRIGELADHIEELQEEINDLRLQVVILSIPKETGDD